MLLYSLEYYYFLASILSCMPFWRSSSKKIASWFAKPSRSPEWHGKYLKSIQISIENIFWLHIYYSFSGIGRCRHSSNFSNRQTPANTNSLNSGSGTHGSNVNTPHNKGNICNCNMKKHKNPGSMISSKWPFDKLKKIFLGYKDSNELGKKIFVTTSRDDSTS